VHRGRVRFLINSVVAGLNSKKNEHLILMFRNFAADNKTESDRRTMAGEPSGPRTAGDNSSTISQNDASDSRAHADSDEHTLQTINELRAQLELREQEDDPATTHRLLVHEALFRINEEEGHDLPAEIQYVVHTELPLITQQYDALKSFNGERIARTMEVRNLNVGNLNESTSENIAQVTESNAVSRLNPGQSSIYNLMLQAADNLYSRSDDVSSTQNLQMLIGGPGTGKTFVVDLIRKLWNTKQQSSSASISENVAVCAPTAVAAQLYETGTTIHTLIGILSEKLVNVTRMKEKMKKLIREAQLLIIDEISMLTVQHFKFLNQRFQQIRNNSSFFGGINSVLLVGDPGRQLPPGVGGIGSTIIAHIVNKFDSSTETLMLRNFRRTELIANQRSLADPRQDSLIRQFNTMPYPITNELLSESCHYCRPSIAEPAGPHTENCTHFQWLTPTAIQNRQAIATAPLICSVHSAYETTIVQRIAAFAKSVGHPVLRWRLPCSTSTGHNSELYNELAEDEALQFPTLWGYFVTGLPIRINHNANLDAKIINGTKGVLHSIRPYSPTNLVESLQSNNVYPGKIITVQAPLACYVSCPTAIEEFRLVPFMTGDSGGSKRLETVTLGKKTHGERSPISVTVISSGYSCSLGGTTYAFQGDTLDVAIMDIGPSKGMVLANITVAASRVRSSKDLFVIPLARDGTGNHAHIQSLCSLRHSDEYYIWKQAYNELGMFQMSQVAGIQNILPQSVLSRPQRPRGPNASIVSTVPTRALQLSNRGRTPGRSNNNSNRGARVARQNLQTGMDRGRGERPPLQPVQQLSSSTGNRNLPTQLELNQEYNRRGGERTQSWAYNTFLATVFGCNIDVNYIHRYALQQHWPLGSSWDSAATTMRQYMINQGIYDALRIYLGFDTNWESYVEAELQELLLGQYDEVIHNLQLIMIPHNVSIILQQFFTIHVHQDIQIPGQLLNQAIIGFRGEALTRQGVAVGSS
jgi:DNA replication protein DnaC